MKKFSILGGVSGALLAGSLLLAGPAAAHRGDAGDGSGAPRGGQTSTSAHTATEGQIGVGIFTNPASAAGTQKPADSVGPAPAYTSRAAVGNELPLGPVGAAPAA